jgi:predicted HicB family RNase H-like nuclease
MPFVSLFVLHNCCDHQKAVKAGRIQMKGTQQPMKKIGHRRKGSGNYSHTVPVRVSTRMHQRLLAMAEDQHATVSSLVRRAVMRDLTQWLREQQGDIAV